MTAPAPRTDLPRLSICIPTHEGRAELLARTLDAIRVQLETDALAGKVEVCVSDNGSEDATQAVIAARRGAFGSAFADHRFERNQGFAPNLLKAVELARGDFCWLLGSDDVIEPGGIAAVLAVCDRHPGLTGITTNRINVDAVDPAGGFVDDARVLPAPGRTAYASAREIFADLSVLQDYISTQIVHRARWLAAVAELGPAGVAAGRSFPHLAVFGVMIQRDPRWYWLEAPLVRHSVGHEALAEDFGRDMLDYVARVTSDRARIWSRLFAGDTELYRSVMRRMFLVQGSANMLAHYKLQPGHSFAKDLRLLVVMLRHYWFVPELRGPSGVMLLLPYPLIPVLVRGVATLRALRGA